MKKWFVLSLLPILLLTACTSKSGEATTPETRNTEEQAQAAQPTTDVKLACREIRSTDDMAPLAEVQLVIDGKATPVDSCMVCGDIDPSHWEDNKIPADAKMAVGGFWAGAGDYFYLKIEGKEAVVYYGWSEEELPIEDSYKYKEIYRASLGK